MNKGIVIIIGTGKGFGFELAFKFGSEGYDIILAGRDTVKLSACIDSLKKINITARFFELDVADPGSIEKFFSKIAGMEQPVSLLIYNAVSRRTVKPSELTASEALDDFSIIVGGAISSAKRIVEIFRRQGKGSVLITGGGVAINPSLQSASMSLSKAALRNYTLNLASELKETGIFAGIITITRPVKKNTGCSSEIVAETFYRMFKEKNEHEIII